MKTPAGSKRPSLKIGLDVGGTNTDAVLVCEGKVIAAEKAPTNHENSESSLWEVLQPLLHEARRTGSLTGMHLSTTLGTNLVVEKKLAPVGMLIESGPGLNPEFLRCGAHTVFLDGSIDHRGTEQASPDLARATLARQEFQARGISALGIATKFSSRNPEHETAISAAMGEGFSPITLGHTLSGRLNFPRRVFTTWLNSGVFATFQQFSSALTDQCFQEGLSLPISIMKADGGLMGLSFATRQPVRSLGSGPAAGVMGGLFQHRFQEDALLLDIGGTTTDIAVLAGGIPLLEAEGMTIGGFPTLIRAVAFRSVGIGGDSCVIPDSQTRTLTIGPQRRGPAYACGGPEPTPTDALIALGLCPLGSLSRAQEVISKLGQILGKSLSETATSILQHAANHICREAQSVLDEVQTHQVQTVAALLHRPKIHPRRVGIVGAPAKTWAPFIERAFRLPVQVPNNPEFASAIGAAISQHTTEISLYADTENHRLEIPELDVRESIPNGFSLSDARRRAEEALQTALSQVGCETHPLIMEVTEEQDFSVINGWHKAGRLIRLRVQNRPTWFPGGPSACC